MVCVSQVTTAAWSTGNRDEKNGALLWPCYRPDGHTNRCGVYQDAQLKSIMRVFAGRGKRENGRNRTERRASMPLLYSRRGFQGDENAQQRKADL